MWQVTNDSLKTIIGRYQTIVESIFLFLIELSKNDDKESDLLEENYLPRVFDNHDLLDSRLLGINRSARDKIKPLITEIIQLDSTVLEDEYAIYLEQNNSINQGDYNLVVQNHQVLLAKLFKDYFYDKFFGIDWIWQDLVGREYSRTMFKTEFKTENRLNICPYCDIDTISVSRNSWIEHFLPKSKFPYLSCNPNNLMPSCTACNVAGTGKGEDVKTPITNQYQIQIGDNIEFNFDGKGISIPPNEEESIENYIGLIKLRVKYQEDTVRDSIISVLKTNYNTFLRINRMGMFDKDLYFDFIHNIGREKGYYFVQKDILKYIGEFE